MTCSCLATRHTHADHCPVAVANRLALRELERFDVRCKTCSTGIKLGSPPFPGTYHPHGYGPFYCESCSPIAPEEDPLAYVRQLTRDDPYAVGPRPLEQDSDEED